jgi:hypothetical protein
MPARAALESLLRARKLDVTLTTPWNDRRADVDLAATGVPAIDEALGGGLRRGHVSEVVGPRSSGRTQVICSALATAASRGEAVALIDACDRFDPVSAVGVGIDLSRLLWVRDTGQAPRALKALQLVLQAGGFGLVVFDIADVPARDLRAFPFTIWLRLARAIEGTQTVALVAASTHQSRSSGGITIALDGPDAPRAEWTGRSDRSRLLQRIAVEPRITTDWLRSRG